MIRDRNSMRPLLLYATGGMGLLCAVFHCLFWAMFDWNAELPKLTAINAAIMQVFNLVVIYVFLCQSFASFYLARKRGAFGFGEKAVLVSTGGVYLIRAAFGFPLFGVNLTEAVVVAFCLAAFLLNLSALRAPLARMGLHEKGMMVQS